MVEYIKKNAMERKNQDNRTMIDKLIGINQNRLIGYSTVASYLQEKSDEDVLALVEKRMQQAQQFKSQLIPFGSQEPQKDEQQDSKYAPWPISPKETNEVRERSTLINICISAEKENVEIYQQVLSDSPGMEDTLSRMIESQIEKLQQTIILLEKCKT